MSKQDQIKALREAKAERKSSRGGVLADDGLHPRAWPSGSIPLKDGTSVGVAPDPRESKRGRPRIGEVRDKPWIAAGMSRRTWYRRKAEKTNKGEAK